MSKALKLSIAAVSVITLVIAGIFIIQTSDKYKSIESL